MLTSRPNLRYCRGAAVCLSLAILAFRDADTARASLRAGQHRSNAAAQSYLSEYAGKGDLRGVMAQLSAGAQLNAADSSGFTALRMAVDYGHTGMVRALLARGADPNLADPSTGITPLMQACSHDNMGLVRILLSAGARVNMVDGLGCTALSRMQGRGNSAIPLLLLAHGANPNAGRVGQIPLTTPLASVAGSGRHAALAAMLAAGADVNRRSLWVPYFALSYAASAGDLYAVRLLLHHGANPTVVGPKGVTPLRAAGYSHNPAVIACIRRAAKAWRAAHKGTPGSSAVPPKEVKFGIP